MIKIILGAYREKGLQSTRSQVNSFLANLSPSQLVSEANLNLTLALILHLTLIRILTFALILILTHVKYNLNANEF